MAQIAWGRPNIFFKKLSGGSWTQMYTPADGTTNLTTTKGEKKEALVEGGAAEDVRYDKNKYALAMTIRDKKGRKMQIKHSDGTVDGEYAVVVQPEDTAVPGIIIEKATVSAEDGFNTTDGGTIIYTFDALVPEDNSNQVKHGVITVSKTGETINSVSYTDDEGQTHTVGA